MTTREDTIEAALADIDEARELGSAVYYPHRVSVLEAGDPFCMRLNVRTFGPLTVGLLRYDSPVHISTGPLEDGFQINVPSSGGIQTSCGSERVLATPGVASVSGPTTPTSIVGWQGDQSMMAVKIARTPMEQTLERLLGYGLKMPLTLRPALALDHGPGAEIWKVLTLLGDQVHDVHAGGSGPDVGASLFDASPFAASLAQSVMTGLLYAQPHNYSDELNRPTATSGPAAIRAAVQFIEERAGEAIVVTDIADHVGLCVRSLQQGFSRYLETTPMAYLRDVRLRGVREALLEGDPTLTSVATVAAAWGFFHLGRFAGQYREAYGESPSETLRRVL